MEDAPLMGRSERPGNLACDPHRIVHGHRASQFVTVHVLEHQIAGANVVKLADVGVIQRGNRACFLLETAQSVGIGSEGLGKDLDRDLAPQTRVTGPIDFAHPSGAQRADDLKRTESGACGQGHADTILVAARRRRAFIASRLSSFRGDRYECSGDGYKVASAVRDDGLSGGSLWLRIRRCW